VDKARAAAGAISRNLTSTHLDDRGTVVTRDVATWLEQPTDHRADLVFVDPPYDLRGPAFDRVFAGIDVSWLGEQDWTVVVTRGHKSSLPGVPLHWSARRQLRYGDSLVILYGP
jgi:16S rRNA G966 N2-methylase RsmD